MQVSAVVDFNDRVRGGHVRAALADLPGVIAGETVWAVDPEEGIRAKAEVSSVDATTGVVLLQVQRHTLERYLPVHVLTDQGDVGQNLAITWPAAPATSSDVSNTAADVPSAIFG